MNNKEKEEGFKAPLIFGTAGIRRHMGLGTSFLNKYTIKMITYAWIKSLEKNSPDDLKKAILVAHDTRNNGTEFANIVAGVISGMGYKAKLIYKNMPVPTPICSYAIRKFNMGGAVCITASHNPPIYNGYKVFDSAGRHLMTNNTNAIQDELEKIDINTEIPCNKSNISFLDESLEVVFVKDILENTPLSNEKKDIKIVFSPLHGASYKLAPLALRKAGFDVYEEPLQSVPDGNFTYVDDPNPENPSAFKLMKKLGKEINADVLLTSDPDGDRVGIAVKVGNTYKMIGGHDIATLLTYYLLKLHQDNGEDLQGKSLIKTVVTTTLISSIARHFKVKVIDTLTGFKYIGDIASKMNPKPLFATEESYGASTCLNLSYDKDSVQILPILADMVNHYKKRGKNLFDILKDIYKKFSTGYVLHFNDREELSGKNAYESLTQLIESISKIKKIGDISVTKIEDFRKGVNGTPLTNLVKVYFGENDSWFAVRPSGTEPLMRKYYCIFEKDETSARTILDKINKKIEELKNA